MKQGGNVEFDTIFLGWGKLRKLNSVTPPPQQTWFPYKCGLSATLLPPVVCLLPCGNLTQRTSTLS